MNIHITIFNYQREEMLDNTLSEIKKLEALGHSFTYSIMDDGSDYSRDNMVKFNHTGKQGFWEKWNYALKALEDTNYDMYMFVPNDYSNYDFTGIINTFTAFNNSNEPFVFNIPNDGRETCWNTIKPIYFNGYKQVFFTDCAFFCNYETLELLGFFINPIDKERFLGNKNISSGVGEQLSKRLNDLKINIYTPNKSFVFHGDHPSTMHNKERQNKPLITQGRESIKELIVVGIATMNSRKKSLDTVLKALRNQSVKPDKIYIYNNDENIFNATDNGKFYGLTEETEPCIFLSMDDDILYPRTYIEDMVKAVKKYNCIITHHGRILLGTNLKYYTDHKSFSCLYKNTHQGKIDVAGTGVTAFRTSYFNPTTVFNSEYKRMSDIVFSLEAAKQQKEILLIPHPGSYLKDICDDVENSCYNKEKVNQQNQITLCNEIYKLNH